MMNYSFYTTVLGVAFILSRTALAEPSGRVLAGQLVDTLRRFPHHVTITRGGVKEQEYCSGSIIADRWILTSFHCVPNGRFTVHFQMKNYNDSRNSYSVTLDESSVVPYPTGFDNIALIKLPVVLRFSEEVAPISYRADLAAKVDVDYPNYKPNNGFVVMPGFSPAHDQGLTYGMFRLISPTECKAKYGKSYDEYLQICTLSWDSYNHVPCAGNEGGGLVIGWPRQPRLIGIFTSPLNCISSMPAIYVNLAKYERWIDEVTRGGYKSYYYWRHE